MRTFVQLKDGVGWAYVNTANFVDGSIEVEYGTGESYLKKKYDKGEWLDAELIRYAELNDNGEIIEVKRTYYSSEVAGPVLLADTKVNSKWVDGVWVSQEPVLPITELEFPPVEQPPVLTVVPDIPAEGTLTDETTTE